MKKIVRLTERELINFVKRIIKEDDLNEGDPGDGKPDSFPEYEGRTDIYADSVIDKDETDDMKQPMAERLYRKKYRIGLREGLEKATDQESKSREICWKHVVDSGDNLWNIWSYYKKYYTNPPSWEDFKANMIEFDVLPEKTLKPGTVLPLPMSCRGFRLIGGDMK